MDTLWLEARGRVRKGPASIDEVAIAVRAGRERQPFGPDPLSPCDLYMGTEGGQVFGSADEGRSWSTLAGYLPPVLSVSVAVV